MMKFVRNYFENICINVIGYVYINVMKKEIDKYLIKKYCIWLKEWFIGKIYV